MPRHRFTYRLVDLFPTERADNQQQRQQQQTAKQTDTHTHTHITRTHWGSCGPKPTIPKISQSSMLCDSQFTLDRLERLVPDTRAHTQHDNRTSHSHPKHDQQNRQAPDRRALSLERYRQTRRRGSKKCNAMDSPMDL